MYGLATQDIELIQKVFEKHPGIQSAILFGSRAMGNFKHASDVDIVIKGNLTQDLISSISIELNEVLPLPYKFDVLGYSFIENLDLKHHIDAFGKLFYSKSSL